MKVRVTVTLDVDPEAWALEYGLFRSEVRDDVQTYYRSLVGDSYPVGNGLATLA